MMIIKGAVSPLRRLLLVVVTSLADLSLDYLDLYLMHFPVAFQRGDVMNPLKANGDIEFDETIHYTDTWLAMEKLVTAGLVRSIGVSNFNSVQIDAIIQKGSIVPAINQVGLTWLTAENCLNKIIRRSSVTPTSVRPS